MNGDAARRKTRIAIDARWIFREISGIGAYTRELMRRLPGLRPDIEFVFLFTDSAVESRTEKEVGLHGMVNVTTARVPYSVFSPRSQLDLPGVLRELGVTVFHAPNYMIPYRAFPRERSGPIRCVTTIHDVIPLLFPGHAPRSKKTRLFPLFRRLIRETARRADAILTVSEASRRDIIGQLAIPAGREDGVHVVYNGVDPRFRPARSAPPAGAGERRILCVGRADPYKNLATAVRAFHAARARLPFPARLILAGPRDDRYPEVPALARELGLGDSVQWTGYLHDDDLLKTYQRAHLLVQPSHYEGFGLPVLEAMACGVPVVCSNGGALPEVAGDAAPTLAPDDVDGYTDRIVDILTNPALHAQLRAKGLAQAAGFTWERTAHRTLDVYERLLAT